MLVLDERCKLYEGRTGTSLIPGLFTLARLDGRAFHTFTKGMTRPYSEEIQASMIAAAKALVKDSFADIAYTQSDEITLLWSTGIELFDGRVQKIASVLSGLASSAFTISMLGFDPERTRTFLPHFDCRLWQVPATEDVRDVFLWREADATKNSLTMAAQVYYSHQELHEKNSADKHNMLHAKGVNWNDFPVHFKRGIYVRRVTEDRTLTPEELNRIPEAHRPSADTRYERHEIKAINVPPLWRVANPTGFLLHCEDPIPVMEE